MVFGIVVSGVMAGFAGFAAILGGHGVANAVLLYAMVGICAALAFLLIILQEDPVPRD